MNANPGGRGTRYEDTELVEGLIGWVGVADGVERHLV